MFDFHDQIDYIVNNASNIIFKKLYKTSDKKIEIHVFFISNPKPWVDPGYI